MSLLIIHFRKSFACGERKRNDSIVIISRLYKSTAPPLNGSVCITSSSLSKPSLRIDLMWLLTLPENTPNKVAISQDDIQTGVVGICTFPFSPMVMISLFIYCCPVKLKKTKSSYSKPFIIGLRGFIFKKQAPPNQKGLAPVVLFVVLWQGCSPMFCRDFP